MNHSMVLVSVRIYAQRDGEGLAALELNIKLRRIRPVRLDLPVKCSHLLQPLSFAICTMEAYKCA